MNNDKNDNMIKNIIRGVIVFLIFIYSVYLQYIPVILFKLNVSKLTSTSKVFLSAFSSIMIMFIFLIIYRKDLKKDFINFKNDVSKYLDIGFRYWGPGLMIMFVTNIIINVVFKAGGANNEAAVQEMIKNVPYMMIISAGIIGPFNEEIVFRKTLKDVFKNKWIFAIVSFILFGGAHVFSSAVTFTDYLYIIPYGALGASFALAYYESDNFFTSCSMHMIHNLVLVVIAIIGYLK